MHSKEYAVYTIYSRKHTVYIIKYIVQYRVDNRNSPLGSGSLAACAFNQRYFFAEQFCSQRSVTLRRLRSALVDSAIRYDLLLSVAY